MSGAKDVYDAVRHPIDTVKGMVKHAVDDGVTVAKTLVTPPRSMTIFGLRLRAATSCSNQQHPPAKVLIGFSYQDFCKGIIHANGKQS